MFACTYANLILDSAAKQIEQQTNRTRDTKRAVSSHHPAADNYACDMSELKTKLH